MARRPNILFSMCDDQRHDAMGCAGHPFLQTPAMDRLAQEGVRFANAFTAVPLCAPSRATHHTGVYPHVHGVFHNRAGLQPQRSTWPLQLQRAGYRTGFIGKIHYGDRGQPQPGFDHWVSFPGQGKYVDPVLNVNGVETPVDGYNTDLLAEHAERFVRCSDGRPWALCLWYKAPHGPFEPPARYRDAYADQPLPVPPTVTASTEGKTVSLLRRQPMGHEPGWYPDGIFVSGKPWETFMRDYARTVRAVDDELGRVLAAIDETGAAAETVVVHTSDHGYFHGEFGLADKRWMYEAAIRVPLLVRYPAGGGAVGRVAPDLVCSVDVPATLMDLAGAGVPDHYQGHTLRPLLTGLGHWPRQDVLIEYFEDPPFPALPTMVCLRTADRKLIHYLRPGESDELYDLQVDPQERSNVIGQGRYAADLATLQERLAQEQRRLGYRLPPKEGDDGGDG